MTYQRVKGTEDFYPKEFALRKAVYDILADEARKAGFLQVNMPAMETIKLLTAKSGEEVKQQIFILEKKGAEELGLRFDLTVPMTRMFVTKQREMQKPVKWFAIEPMWRYEAPQKGRQREFVQLSCELFGSENPEADATCVNLILACMQRFCFTSDDVQLRINNRKLLEGILENFAPPEKIGDVIHLIDKSGKISAQEFTDGLRLLGVTNTEAVKSLIAMKGKPEILERVNKEFQLNERAKKGLAELRGTLAFVDGKYVTVDLSIARGLAYYTGNVFELFDTGGKFRAIAGGGRYDELVGLFGGESTPATGFAIGAETLLLLLADRNKLPASRTGPDVFVAPVDEKQLARAQEIAQTLRAQGMSADMDLLRRKLAKQLDYASASGARFAVIVGEKDLALGNLTVKDLAAGLEEKVPLNKIAEALHQKIQTAAKKNP